MAFPVAAALQFAGPILGGLFGGNKKPKIPKELKRLYDFQYGMADQLRRFAQSAPLSDPQEAAGYAQARGELGSQQTQQREQINSLYNPLYNKGNASNALLNVGNQQIGQNMALQSSHVFNALAQRRQALLQASGIGQAAANAAQYHQQPQVDLAGAFGGLASAIAQKHAFQQQQNRDQTTALDSYIGGTPVDPHNQQNPAMPANPFATQSAGGVVFDPAAQAQSLQQNFPANVGTGGGAAPLGGQSQLNMLSQSGWTYANPRLRQAWQPVKPF